MITCPVIEIDLFRWTNRWCNVIKDDRIRIPEGAKHGTLLAIAEHERESVWNHSPGATQGEPIHRSRR